MVVLQDLNQVLAAYIGLSPNDIHQLTELPAEQIFENPTYKTLIEGLDTEFLKKTLPEARTAYALGLPAFMARLEHDVGINHMSMSAYTLGDWLIRFLEAPETIPVVLNMHLRLTRPIIRAGLPYLLEMLSTMPRGQTEWQRALAIMSLPLVAKW